LIRQAEAGQYLLQVELNMFAYIKND